MYKLIIIEDDIQIRNGLSKFFPWEEIGFELAGSFGNGWDALNFLTAPHAPPINIILSDIRMPVMDGLKFAEELKKTSCKAQIVFLSAYRNFEYAQKAITLNVKNYIVKSSKYDELVGVFKDIKRQLDKGLSGLNRETLPNQKNAGREDGDHIRQILQAIDLDIANATLQSISGKFRMNPVYFSRYFKIKTGENFLNYIIKRKMELAASYLLEKDMAISEISRVAGYSNEKNFSRAFKRYYGVNPSNFRRFKETPPAETP